MDVPQGTAAEVLAWVGDDPERAGEALSAEYAGQYRSTLIAKLETIAAKEATVSETTAPPEVPEAAPAPEPPEDLVVDLLDQATHIGSRNVRNPEVEVPDDNFDAKLAEAKEAEAQEAPLDATQVEFFQVASSNGVVVIRFDDSAVMLDGQQAIALSKDLRQALAALTY